MGEGSVPGLGVAYLQKGKFHTVCPGILQRAARECPLCKAKPIGSSL